MTDLLRLLPDNETAVAFAPRRLGLADRWRFVLRRLFPRSGDPIRRAIGGTILSTIYLGGVGSFVGWLVNERGSLVACTLIGLSAGVILPLRYLRAYRTLLGQIGPDVSYSIGIHPAGLTVHTGTRFLVIAWSTVGHVRVSQREAVVILRSPDVVSAPLSAFTHDGHLVGFVQAVEREVAQAKAGGAI